MSISTPNAISTPSTSPTITTDALIIGFGKGGKTLAAKLSAAGRKVVVAEASADMYGGTCIRLLSRRSAASLRCCATRTITSSPTKTTSP